MKVLYFHQHFSTPSGSAGIRSYENARRLVERGHDVTMVCGSYRGGRTGLVGPFTGGVRRGRVDGIDVVEFELAYANADSFLKRAVTFLRFALRSIGLIFTERYDVVFATTTPLTAGIPGVFARWLRRKPFVFEVRDLWPELPREMGVITNPVVIGLMSALEWSSYHSARRLIALSPGIAEGIARRGIEKACITTVPNGCDLALFSNRAEPWRPSGIEASDLMAVFAGTHGIANGLDAVLDGAKELKRRDRSDIKIVLIGEGKLKDRLRARARHEGLDNVIFHEPVDKQCLSNLFATADLGMQVLANVPAFYYGTSPNKFFDYIAAGLPVLNNYPGWVADMIKDNDCGYVTPPSDSVAFADALEHAAEHPEVLKEQGLRARELAVSRFERTELADILVDWLEQTVNEGTADAGRKMSGKSSGL